MTTTNGSAGASAIEATLKALFDEGDVIEIRAIKCGRDGTVRGYYNDFAKAARDAGELDKRAIAVGLYVTLNRLDPAHLALCANRLETRADKATADTGVVRRRYFLIDLDPKRSGAVISGISATDEEMRAARDRAQLLEQSLRARGWPEPIVALSGNGTHVLYHMDAPNDAATNQILKSALEGLAAEFGGNGVDVDRTVFSAAQIFRLYGTTARKGDDLPDRPHRRSRLISIPATREIVTLDMLRELAPKATAAPEQTRERAGSFDVDAFMIRHAIAVKRRESYAGGERIILAACPFDAGHAGGNDAAILVAGDGRPGFKCFHNGCEGRDWKALREKFDPSSERRSTASSSRKSSTNGTVHATSRPGDEKPADQTDPQEPVDLGALLNRIAAFCRRYVVMPRANMIAQAIWVAHTYVFSRREITAYLAILSPEKRSGKSRNLEVLARLVRAPMKIGGISGPALFRYIETAKPTVLWDEVDTVFGPKAKEAEDLRALLNNGFEVGNFVWRCVGNSLEPKPFDPFCPKVLAGIGKALPDTVMDRSIVVALQRRKPSERVSRFRRQAVEVSAQPIRAQLERWAANVVSSSFIHDAEPIMPDTLNDRAQDIWEPLIAIADLAGGRWPKRARDAAIALSDGEAVEDNSVGVRLLIDIRAIFGEARADSMQSARLASELTKIEESPWGKWNDDKGVDPSDKGIDASGVARLLKKFGIRPKKIRFGAETAQGYRREWFSDAWDRYAPEKAARTRNTRNKSYSTGVSADFAPGTEEPAFWPDNSEKPFDINDVPGVPTKTAPEGGGTLFKADADAGLRATKNAPQFADNDDDEDGDWSPYGDDPQGDSGGEAAGDTAHDLHGLFGEPGELL